MSTTSSNTTDPNKQKYREFINRPSKLDSSNISDLDKQKYGEYINSLSESEIDQLKKYKTESDTCNDILRSSLPVALVDTYAECSTTIRTVKDIIEMAPRLSVPMTVYKGVSKPYIELLMAKVGDIIDMLSLPFVSTSTNIITAGWFAQEEDNYVYTIELPKNTKGIYLASTNKLDPGEEEYLLPPGTYYKIISITKMVIPVPKKFRKWSSIKKTPTKIYKLVPIRGSDISIDRLWKTSKYTHIPSKMIHHKQAIQAEMIKFKEPTELLNHLISIVNERYLIIFMELLNLNKFGYRMDVDDLPYILMNAISLGKIRVINYLYQTAAVKRARIITYHKKPFHYISWYTGSIAIVRLTEKYYPVKLKSLGMLFTYGTVDMIKYILTKYKLQTLVSEDKLLKVSSDGTLILNPLLYYSSGLLNIYQSNVRLGEHKVRYLKSIIKIELADVYKQYLIKMEQSKNQYLDI